MKTLANEELIMVACELILICFPGFQEDIMMELQSTLESSSKELEIAKIKLDKRDKMLKEKETIVEELQKKLDAKNGKI